MPRHLNRGWSQLSCRALAKLFCRKLEYPVGGVGVVQWQSSSKQIHGFVPPSTANNRQTNNRTQLVLVTFWGFVYLEQLRPIENHHKSRT